MPCSRIGRSTSTTPWSKSISITRSATMHSRPIATCWNAEIVHSWPSTVFAPIDASPSWTRIFVPWPIHDQRPSCSVAPRPISNVTPGPTKHSPSVCSRPRQRSLSHAQRSASRAYFALSIPWRAREAQQRERAAGRAASARRGRRARLGWLGDGRPSAPPILGGCDDPRPMADDRSLAERLLAGDKRALARGISLVEDDDPEGWALVREVYPQTGRARRSSASPARPAPASRR